MALTGGTYRFTRNVIGMEKTTVGWLLSLHHMAYLPNWLSVLWVTIVYISVVSLILSGTRLLPIVNNYFQPPNSYQILISNGNQQSIPSSSSIDNDLNSNIENSTSVNSNNNSGQLYDQHSSSLSNSNLNDSDQIITIDDINCSGNSTITNENVSSLGNSNTLLIEEEDDYSVNQQLNSQNNSQSSITSLSPSVIRNKSTPSLDTID
ncbi:hypothetical protein DLAC_04571 [Tieghemostelium lacteum]|uniref:Uncharacterized protein n=1 Tax=Tieghemostelium lacteum TaxID=361077 RepID=A0A151ZJU7_TIELA|nr:hypothetical protein DLAC_04571 [Tieghemostelium lacteum]|eukprot:KYQ94272.1 hypothetical protein DLAC_04571 [Tieghemostelium lacteum]